MKTMKKRGIFAALAAVLLVTAMLVTCTDPIIPGGLTAPKGEKGAPFTPPPGKGYIRVSIPAESARTILPTNPGTLYYKVDVIGTGGNAGNDYDESDVDDGDADFDGDSEIIVVVPGAYTVTVSAHTAATLTSGTLIATGQDTVTVGTGGETVNIILAINDDDDGIFTYNITPTPSSASVVVTVEEYPSGTSTTPTSGATLASGYYWVRATLTATKYQTTTFSQILHIYGNQTSPWTVALSIPKNRYDVTYDHNYTPGKPAPTVDQGPSNGGYTHGSDIAAPTPPTRANYTFDGWFKEAGTTTAWVFSGGTTPDVLRKDTTLYAAWLTVTTEELEITIDPYDPPAEKTFTFTPPSTSFTQAQAIANSVSSGINIVVTGTMDALDTTDGWYYGSTQVSNTATLTGTAISTALTGPNAIEWEVINPTGYEFTFKVHVGGVPYNGIYKIIITEN